MAIVGLRFLDDAAHRLEGLQRGLAHLQDAGLVGHIAAEVAEPGDALALEIRLQGPAKIAPVAGHRQRRAGIVARLHREQQREIGDIARHRARPRPSTAPDHRARRPARGRSWCESRIRCSSRPDCAGCRHSRCRRRPAACAAPATPPRRRCCRPPSATGHRHCGSRHRPDCRCASPRPNSGVLVLPMKIAPALRRRSTMTLSAAGTKSLKIGEPGCGHRDALDRRQVLHRQRKAVQRPHGLAARHLRIALARLRQTGPRGPAARRWR